MARVPTLRLRLTLWYLVVFASLQLALLLATILLRQESTRGSFDAELAHSASVMVENILIAEPAWGDLDVSTLIPTDAPFVLSVVRNAEGHAISSTADVDADRVPFSETERVAAGPAGPVFTDVEVELARTIRDGSGGLRMITVPFSDNVDQRYYLQAAVPARSWTQVFAPFRDLLVFGMPIGLIAACVAAWLIAGRAVLPLRRMSAAAQIVSPEKLGERIDIDARDDEVHQLERELNHALARIEAGYRAHERFVSAVSHELKTPIAVLLAESQTLREGVASVEEHASFAESVEEEMRRLSTLVESLLSLTRAEVVWESREVRLGEVAHQAVDRCRPLAAARGIELEVDADAQGRAASLAGDPRLLLTMAENLMRNAVRFSPEGEAVRVVVEPVEDGVRLSVSDRGPGIPPEYLERVFDPFVQAPQDVERAGGTGLGLSIAQKIAHVHGGGIAARNHEDEGCTFEVLLPTAHG